MPLWMAWAFLIAARGAPSTQRRWRRSQASFADDVLVEAAAHLERAEEGPMPQANQSSAQSLKTPDSKVSWTSGWTLTQVLERLGDGLLLGQQRVGHAVLLSAVGGDEHAPLETPPGRRTGRRRSGWPDQSPSDPG